MPKFIVNLKENATDAQVDDAKKTIESQGGEIKETYTLIKAFLVEFPEGQLSTLESHEAVSSVEEDGVVTTQKKTG